MHTTQDAQEPSCQSLCQCLQLRDENMKYQRQYPRGHEKRGKNNLPDSVLAHEIFSSSVHVILKQEIISPEMIRQTKPFYSVSQD